MLKSREHSKYHQYKDVISPKKKGIFGPTPGKNAISTPAYNLPKNCHTRRSGMKNRNETFIDCHIILD
ncbi:MAG: hypothetical protein QXH37_07710, partial [Candidatus Bathyarchaeia archaeon]